MTYKDQVTGGSIPRWLQVSRRGRQVGGIAIAVAGAGLMAALTGCGPLTVAATGHPHNGHTATTGGHQTTSPTSSSSSTGSTTSSSGSGAYSFTTLDNPADPTFNQLLGFNNGGIIAGYFGSGAAGHPNKGYVLVRTRAGFRIMNENFPGSTQTQVTGLNDRGVTVGFWSDMNASQNNANFGFYWLNGRFHTVNFPTRSNATPPVNQLLGVNDQNIAVGFYNDAKGNAHGYTYSIRGGWFRPVTIRGASSVTAAAINNSDDVAGFFTNAAGTTTDGFLRTGEGRTYTLAYPGASMTQALGVNDYREVVGVYTVGSGNSAVTHGFTWTPRRGFKSVDDPQGVGSTTINGVNDFGDIVGFYTDSAGNTDGFAAVPAGQRPLPGLIGATTTPTPTTPPTTAMPTTTPASTMPTTTPASTMPTTTPASTGSANPTPSGAPSTFSGSNS